jgi:hypothetical protein
VLAGHTSLVAIADELNARGMLTRRGGRWHKSTVMNLLDRLGAQEGGVRQFRLMSRRAVRCRRGAALTPDPTLRPANRIKLAVMPATEAYGSPAHSQSAETPRTRIANRR